MNTTQPIVLIVHPGTLGDVLLAVEALRSIRKGFPSHRIVWVGHSEIGNWLLACEEVHSVVGIEGQFFSQLLTLTPSWDGGAISLLEQCTHCVAWMTDHDGIMLSNLQSRGIRCLIQSPHSQELEGYHQEERFLNTLALWGINTDSPKKRTPFINSAFPDLDVVKNEYGFLNGPYVVVHPGSGSKHKCLNASLFAKVAKRLLEISGMTLVILSGPADHELVTNFLHKMPPGHYPVLSNRTLSTVAAVLKGAAWYMGHDSGLSHLAAGVGTPTMVIFGPTNPTFWAPKGDHVNIIQGPPCSCDDWELVQQCQGKPCLEFPVPVILQKVEECFLASRNLNSSGFHSKMSSDNQTPSIQTLDASYSHSGL